MTWAEPRDGQSRPVFLIDITTCPDCGGRLRWIAGGRLRGPPADITEPTAIRTILLHVQSRAPPRGNRPDADSHFPLAG